MIRKVYALLFTLLIFSATVVSAEVYTTQKTEGYADCIYVIGSHDSFPIEYYNDETERFEGVMPDLLGIISRKTDMDFVYVNGGNKDIDMLAQNIQAEIVSAYDINSNKAYITDFVEVFSYSSDNRINKTGFAFTSIADVVTKAELKNALSQISHSEIDSLVMKYAGQNSHGSGIWVAIMIFVSIVLLLFIILLVLQNKRIKRKNRIDLLTDNETGIGNLSYFKYRFEETIDDFQRSISYVAYIILDSSYLRSYHGSATFSDVLKYTAETVSSAALKNEFAARITENGFAFVYSSPNEAEAKTRLDEIMKKLNEYVDVGEKSSKLVFHAAVYNLLRSDRNSEILLFNLRKNCNKIFGTEQQIVVCDVHSMNKVQEEKKIVENIIKGFENNEFVMYLQFVVDTKTKQIVSAESLSRWDSKEKGLLSPGKYIGIMENDGLISRHDFNMFEMVCRQLERWNKSDFGHISISCNFTRITLSEEGFIDKVNEICEKYTFDRSKVCIEITEDAIEKNMENALSNIAECKKLGFRIALDDLGSGYTSLSNLCDYPIDIVKIDRDILLKADTDRGKALFEGIVELSHKLNLKVICEGVETEEQETLVTKANCDYIQGYYYYKPLPKDEAEKILS